MKNGEPSPYAAAGNCPPKCELEPHEYDGVFLLGAECGVCRSNALHMTLISLTVDVALAKLLKQLLGLIQFQTRDLELSLARQSL